MMTPRTTRVVIPILTLFTVSSLLFYLPLPRAHLPSVPRPWTSASAAPPAQCPPDPYRRMGFLHQPADTKDSVWVPYAEEMLEQDPPASAAYPPPKPFAVFADDRAPENVTATWGPRNWMKELDGSLRAIKEGREGLPSMEWLRDRRVLIFGDSIDYWQMQIFCETLGAQLGGTKHKTGGCHVEQYNFTIAHWHVPSLYTSRPDWWWVDTMETVALEERWGQIYDPDLPTVTGRNGRPDLILYQTGSWDQRMFIELGLHHPDESLRGEEQGKMGSWLRQLSWSEQQFYMARLQVFISQIRAKFGNDVPMMYRTLTYHNPAREEAAYDASIDNLDRINRLVCAHHRVEIFEWAKLVRGFSDMYLDHIHYGFGSGAWLWSNMMLGYLHRAVVEGWEQCHGAYLEQGKAVW